MAGFWTLLRVLRERQIQERSCRWSRAQLEQHQARELGQLRRVALARSPFYREFHRGLEQRGLEDLPILTKALMMERFDDLVTDRAIRLQEVDAWMQGDAAGLYRGKYVALATSGSTGRRGVFLFDKREWIDALAAITRPIAWGQQELGKERVLRSAIVTSTTSWHYSARVGATLATRLVPSLRLDAAMPLAEMVERLNAWQPAALAVYPSVLRQLALEQLAGRLRVPLRSIGSSAEVLTADVRGLVREAWGIAVRDIYGATEYAPIASECAQGRKHLYENGAVIELVDDRGRRVPEGERADRILLSIFRRFTQPLIRYEISDLVRGVADDCPCGRPYRIIESIDGRQEEILYFPRLGGGAVVAAHPNLFHDALERVPVAGWQVMQDEGGLTIRLLGAGNTDVPGAVEKGIRSLLDSLGADLTAVTVVPVEKLERGATGKAPLIFSRRRGPRSP